MPKNISGYVKRYLHELLKRKSLKKRKTAVFCVLGGPGKRPYYCLIVSGITLSESLNPFLSDSMYYSTIQNEFFFREAGPQFGGPYRTEAITGENVTQTHFEVPYM